MTRHATALFVLLVAFGLPLHGSDHADPILLDRLPLVSERLEAGITDLFAFPDGDRLVVILAVRRALGSGEKLSLKPYTYSLFMDVHSVVRYDDPEDLARYGGTVVQPEKIDPDVRIDFRLGNDGELTGEPVIKGLKNPESVKVDTGIFDDPFIFPRFFGTNVVAMVLAIPFDSFPRGTRDWLIWATSSRAGKQIDHVGRSNRTMQPRFDFLNKLPPNQHVHAIRHAQEDPGLLREILRNELEPTFAFREYDFAPDVMIFTTRREPGYPNGRRLEDDVVKLTCEQGDCLLYELSFRETAQGQRPTRNDKPFRTEFPYLADPWEPTQPLPPLFERGRHVVPALTLTVAVLAALGSLAVLKGWFLHKWFANRRERE